MVLLTGIMTYVQNRNTASVMASFKNMAADAALAIRDGAQVPVAPVNLVVGDVIVLSGGRTAPADARIIATNGLKCDFSSLTGESDAIRMQVRARAGSLSVRRPACAATPAAALRVHSSARFYHRACVVPRALRPPRLVPTTIIVMMMMQVDAANPAPEESKNIAFSSCAVLEGEGLAVVIRTGACAHAYLVPAPVLRAWRLGLAAWSRPCSRF